MMISARTGSSYVGTEHILLAIVSESDSYATKLIQKAQRKILMLLQMRLQAAYRKAHPENQFSGMEKTDTHKAKKRAAPHWRNSAEI